jgi:tetratricopeptide (TPR) repeat protein
MRRISYISSSLINGYTMTGIIRNPDCIIRIEKQFQAMNDATLAQSEAWLHEAYLGGEQAQYAASEALDHATSALVRTHHFGHYPVEHARCWIAVALAQRALGQIGLAAKALDKASSWLAALGDREQLGAIDVRLMTIREQIVPVWAAQMAKKVDARVIQGALEGVAQDRADLESIGAAKTRYYADAYMSLGLYGAAVKAYSGILSKDEAAVVASWAKEELNDRQLALRLVAQPERIRGWLTKTPAERESMTARRRKAAQEGAAQREVAQEQKQAEPLGGLRREVSESESVTQKMARLQRAVAAVDAAGSAASRAPSTATQQPAKAPMGAGAASAAKTPGRSSTPMSNGPTPMDRAKSPVAAGAGSAAPLKMPSQVGRGPSPMGNGRPPVDTALQLPILRPKTPAAPGAGAAGKVPVMMPGRVVRGLSPMGNGQPAGDAALKLQVATRGETVQTVTARAAVARPARQHVQVGGASTAAPMVCDTPTQPSAGARVAMACDTPVETAAGKQEVEISPLHSPRAPSIAGVAMDVAA